MHFASWVPKATDTCSKYEIFIFHSNSGYTNEPQCYIYTYVACLVVLTFNLQSNCSKWCPVLASKFHILFTQFEILKCLSGKRKQLIKYFHPLLLPFCLHKCLSCLDASLVNAEVIDERHYEACLLISVSTIYLCELLHVLHEISISLFFISQFLEKGPKN